MPYILLSLIEFILENQIIEIVTIEHILYNTQSYKYSFKYDGKGHYYIRMESGPLEIKLPNKILNICWWSAIPTSIILQFSSKMLNISMYTVGHLSPRKYLEHRVPLCSHLVASVIFDSCYCSINNFNLIRICSVGRHISKGSDFAEIDRFPWHVWYWLYHHASVE